MTRIHLPNISNPNLNLNCKRCRLSIHLSLRLSGLSDKKKMSTYPTLVLVKNKEEEEEEVSAKYWHYLLMIWWSNWERIKVNKIIDTRIKDEYTKSTAFNIMKITNQKYNLKKPIHNNSKTIKYLEKNA